MIMPCLWVYSNIFQWISQVNKIIINYYENITNKLYLACNLLLN